MMKKVSLLLGIAILFYYVGVAQKTNTRNLIPAHVNKHREQMVQNYHFIAEVSAQKINPSKTPLSGYYMESFEGTFLPNGWTKQTLNSTHDGWSQCVEGTTPLYGMWEGTQTVPPMGGDKVAFCSYLTGSSSVGYDQWLITPQFTVASGDSLKFYIFRYGAFQDSLDVVLSTSGNNISAFTTTLLCLDTSKTPDNSWKQYAIDLTPFSGQNVYIAFREHVLKNPDAVVGAYYALDRVFLGSVGSLTDVATSSIDMNPKYLQSTYVPTATVLNEGIGNLTFNVTMTINPGAYTSTKTVTNLASGTAQQVTFDSWNATQLSGNYTVNVFTSLQGDMNPNNDTLTKQVNVIAFKNKAYVFVVFDFSFPTIPLCTAIYDLADSSNVWILNQNFDTGTYPWVMGGAWANNHWYGTNINNEFVDIDTLTGEITIIGDLGFLIRDIAYDKISGMMYGITQGVGSVQSGLYTINTTSGAATYVGDLGQTGFNTLACKQGILYATNQTTDKLYSVDKTTGLATEIGSFGFNSNEYSQGLDFAPDGNLFMAAYNYVDQSYEGGELRILNTITGSSEYLHQFTGGYGYTNNITGFVIPGSSWEEGLNINDLPNQKLNTVVYPNPANEMVNIICSDQIMRIKLVNVFGQIVLYNNSVNSSTFTLNTSNLANGFYYLQIEAKSGSVTKNITVQK